MATLQPLPRHKRIVPSFTMHLQVHTPSNHNPPSITVCGEEVPLPLYWRTVDLWSAGHTSDSIVVHIVASGSIPNVELLRDIVRNIVWNQELIRQGSLLTPTNDVAHTKSQSDTRRNSRISDVDEVDDLQVAQMVAEKKQKERASLRNLLSKLG